MRAPSCRSSMLRCRREGDQLVEASRYVDLPIPEQVIEVPKISSSSSQAQGSPQHAYGGTVGGSGGIRAVCLSVPAADR